MVAYQKHNRICQFCGLKSGRGRLKNEKWSLTREFLKHYLTEKQNGYFQSGRLREVYVVAYEMWSLEES